MTRRGLIVAVLLLVALSGCIGDGSKTQASETDDALPDGFSAEQVPYERVSQLSDVDGEVAYVGKNDTGSYLVHGDSIIAHAPVITQYRFQGGEWAYITGDGEGERYVYIDGERHGPYDEAYLPAKVVESWAYGASVDGDNKLFYKGIDISQKYRFTAPEYAVVNEELAYAALAGSTDETVIVRGDAELTRGTDVKPAVDSINDKLLYARTADDGTVTLRYGIKNIPTGYETVRGYTGINNSLYYIASDRGSGDHVLSFPEENEYGPYDHVERIVSVAGYPAIVVSDEESGGADITYRGETYGGDHDVAPSSVTAANDNIAYYARPDGGIISGTGSIIYDGQELDTIYNPQDRITAVDGKLVFAAERNGNTYLVHEQ